MVTGYLSGYEVLIDLDGVGFPFWFMFGCDDFVYWISEVGLGEGFDYYFLLFGMKYCLVDVYKGRFD